MSVAGSQPKLRREPSTAWVLVLALGLSFVGHAATLFILPSQSKPLWTKQKPVELVMIDVPPPPPPPEEKKEEPKPKPVVKLPEPKPPPKELAPPPPNEPPPPDVPAKPVPIVVGISLSSTTATGGFAAPVGNTLYGKASDKAENPADVKPYAAPKYVPPGGADTDPELVGEVKIPYPEEAKKNEIEGSVRLKVTVDENGAVTDVRVVNGPGYGLNEAARDALWRFRFRPATKNGEAVGTTFMYTYTFLLD